MKTRLTAQICLLAGSLFLGIAGPAHAAGWTNGGFVTAINQQQASGAGASAVFVDINVSSNPTDASACTARKGFYFSVTDDRTKRMFAMLMAAELANRQVQVFTTGTCHAWGYAEIDGAVLLKD